jgi:hypothetical protein
MSFCVEHQMHLQPELLQVPGNESSCTKMMRLFAYPAPQRWFRLIVPGTMAYTVLQRIWV